MAMNEEVVGLLSHLLRRVNQGHFNLLTATPIPIDGAKGSPSAQLNINTATAPQVSAGGDVY